MNTETTSRNTLTRDQLNQMCGRFPAFRGADATHWLATGDRLGGLLLALTNRMSRKRTTAGLGRGPIRRRDELDGLCEAYSVD